jgi:hypothetical protein
MRAAKPPMAQYVKKLVHKQGGRAGKSRRRFGWGVAAASLLITLAMVPVADARVNPLVIIERQIHKANMLIVLDTSGSMTGVPGGSFSSLSEAGVDCNNGTNCRNSGVQAVCKTSGRTCLSDTDCRVGRCSLTPALACSDDVPCPAVSSTCSVTGGVCSSDLPCPAQPSTCSATGVVCDATHPCAAYATCQYGNMVCNPADDHPCPATGYCQKDPTKVCNNDNQCPQNTSGGSCSSGGTPPSGCSDQSDCPVMTKCQGTDETCRGDITCPGPSKGRCNISGDVCNNNSQCKTDGDFCVQWTNSCMGPPNPCTLPFSKCDSVSASQNSCIGQTNTCTAHLNTCVSAGTNVCQPPPDLTDTCIPGPKGGKPGPIRMCVTSNTVCTQDKDCPSGDACGPATSRMMIAKKAVNSLVSNNYDIVNFGLMTFYQNGYFPYYPTGAGGSTTSYTVFEDKDKLVANGCWLGDGWGPAPVCTIAGTQLRLQTLVNSTYQIPTGPGTSETMDMNYCGLICTAKGNSGTGLYLGSYYNFDGNNGMNAGTAVVQSTYTGKTIDVSGTSYTYYQAATNYYSGGAPPPLTFTDCENTLVCGARCGGRWDSQLAPFLDTSDNLTVSHNNALAIGKALEAASYGGLMAYWSTPIGCTLENTGAPNLNSSAYHYMQAVKNGDAANAITADHVACRSNFVLLVTDGAANGPGDIDASGNSLCTAAACAAANPAAAGCTCKSVLAAYDLRTNLGVKTYVVGFAGDTGAGSTAYAINENIARAGGTDKANDGVAPFHYQANNAVELDNALQLAVLDAVKGSYSTAPTSSSAGTQQATTVAEGRYALDSRMDFPEWKGHLLCYDLLTNGTPCVNDPTKMCPSIVWDAYTTLSAMNWKTRRVYTYDGANMVKIQVNSDGTIANAGQLATLGLGANADEAGRVARWALGDPTYGNRALLGAIVNSTPIDVASPGDIPLPGGHAFFQKYMTRPHLVYVGSSDGMLHAFFLETTTIGSTTYPAGQEAFAFIPPDMLQVVRKQYVQGGQYPSPFDHVFGVADSPKAKTMCVSHCNDDATAVWKTLLLVPEGYGGNELFMLDVTNPFAGINALADPPITMQWHSNYGSQKDSYDAALGQTISLPAFFMNKTANLDDYRIINTSGYAVTSGSTTQGRTLLTSSAADGTIRNSYALAPVAACTQEYTNLTDVATARDFAKDQDNKILAGYFGDTAGREWRYVLGSAPVAAQDFGCNHPLHFSPTVVQLDRDSTATTHAHEIYPVQVTNSNLDLDTTNLPPSKMIFWKEYAATDAAGNVTGVSVDTSWGTGGKIELTTGIGTQICATTVTDAEGHITCSVPMPTNARPTATPIGILKKDASGFQVYTMWYATAPDGCTKGQTYFTIHDMTAGVITQRLGAMVAAEPVTSPVIIRGQVMIFGAGGAYNITGLAPDGVTAGIAAPPGTGSGQFVRFNWTEVLD